MFLTLQTLYKIGGLWKTPNNSKSSQKEIAANLYVTIRARQNQGLPGYHLCIKNRQKLNNTSRPCWHSCYCGTVIVVHGADTRLPALVCSQVVGVIAPLRVSGYSRIRFGA